MAALRRRDSIRLKDFNYSQPDAYFVTICTHNRECLFGNVAEGEIKVNELGQIVSKCWAEIPYHFGHVMLDAFVVMPNHAHGIIFIAEREYEWGVGARHAVPLLPSNSSPTSLESFGKPIHGSIPTIIRSFKSAVSKRINTLHNTPGQPIWQRNYYERIIRNERELSKIRQYVQENPLKWDLDPENLHRHRMQRISI